MSDYYSPSINEKKSVYKDKQVGRAFGKHDGSAWTAVRDEPCNLERKSQCWINTINTVYLLFQYFINIYFGRGA